MQRNRRVNVNRAIVISLMVLGVFCIILSAFYSSSYLAIIGVSFIFWGGILLYITPSKHVPITFLTASTAVSTSNIERLLTELKTDEKAVYLPPKNLEDAESSLIFIPKAHNQPLPTPQETKTASVFNEKQGCLFLTPPGSALTKLYEQRLGNSFTKIAPKDIQKNLSKLLVEDFGIAEHIEMQIQNNRISVEIKGSIFREDCQETQKYPLMHTSIGCLLSSSLGCVLAKATGKSITIESEEHPDIKTTKIRYQILEE